MAPPPEPANRTTPAPLTPPRLQVIAMHGWCGEARHWAPWREACAAQGWSWQSGERGYGAAEPLAPSWQPAGLRVVIAHSMGPHLLCDSVLAAADAVVLLASFGRFVPPGPPGRRLRSALAGMAARLGDAGSARMMLREFMAEAAAPQSSDLLPAGPADGPLGAPQLQRLQADLDRLGRTAGLPEAFPPGIPVLSLEANEDRIVVPEARRQLRLDLEARRCPTRWLSLEGTGHALLQPGLVDAVLDWMQRLETR